MDVVILESCHSTWVFDLARMRFCRILRGIGGTVLRVDGMASILGSGDQPG